MRGWVKCSRRSGIYRRQAALSALLALIEVIGMLDFVMIALGVGFFVASVLYVLACERM